ncbi:FecCD family ABC transporter permease [Streptomyces sp. NPDC056500]|uniref:FecCD family ABC transporter permease n=1 Tax=Streptomyces sp. NPDC056500 TaxID=3345840 RepID=UPI0036777865
MPAPVPLLVGTAPTGEESSAPAGPESTRSRAVTAVVLLAALAALCAAVLLSLAVGARHISPMVVFEALLQGGGGEDGEVVRDLRIPRTIIGVLVGAAFALSGTVLQGLTRNPIADPSILGISQGAAAGVVLAITFAGIHTILGYVWFALVGAALATVAVYAVAHSSRGGASPVKLALAGAAISALLASVTMGVLSTRVATLDEFRFWQVGGIAGRDAEVIHRIWPFLLVGAVLVVSVARGLDALALGEDMAKGLGRNVAAVRIVGGVGATLLAGAAVAVAGPLAFIGLAVPHMARRLVGSSHGRVMLLGALIGPVMLLASDVVGRIVFPPGEIPAGVMTALIGVPFLVVLVRRKEVPA